MPAPVTLVEAVDGAALDGTPAPFGLDFEDEQALSPTIATAVKMCLIMVLQASLARLAFQVFGVGEDTAQAAGHFMHLTYVPQRVSLTDIGVP